MTSSDDRPPVHETLTVLDFEDVYHNDDWRKSVVRYRYDESTEYDEVAVYLWHREDGDWTRKNKYVVKTVDAWRTDREIVDRLFDGSAPALSTDDVPVNDYYNVVAGETVFQSDDWWKAIVMIDQKGSYETDEAFIYLWQRTDDEWRRRQKYTIKSEKRWAEEAAAIESVLGVDETDRESTTPDSPESTRSDDPKPTTPDSPEPTRSDDPDAIDQLSRELDAHLSESLRD